MRQSTSQEINGGALLMMVAGIYADTITLCAYSKKRSYCINTKKLKQIR